MAVIIWKRNFENIFCHLNFWFNHRIFICPHYYWYTSTIYFNQFQSIKNIRQVLVAKNGYSEQNIIESDAFHQATNRCYFKVIIKNADQATATERIITMDNRI